LEAAQACELSKQTKALHEQAMKDSEAARVAARDAEIEGVRKMTAMNARYQWRMKYQKVDELEGKVFKNKKNELEPRL
jgi:hypothetical protein